MTSNSIRSAVSGAAVLTLGLLAACVSTQVASIKKDPSFNAKSMHHVLVIAVVKKPKTQHLLEDEFLRNLKKRGGDGVASYALVPEGNKLDEAAWKKVVADGHFDAVIVSRLVDLDVVEKDVDPKYLGYSGTGYGYYNMSYAATYQPGFSYRKETAAVETRVFDAAESKMVWSAQSKTDIEQGRDPAAQIRDFVSLMMSKIYN